MFGFPWWLRSIKNLPAKTWVPSLGWEDALEKEMATHSSILGLQNLSLNCVYSVGILCGQMCLSLYIYIYIYFVVVVVVVLPIY